MEKKKIGLDQYLQKDGKEIGYWRKANQIHKFFSDKLTIENCEEYEVSQEMLEELHELCKQVLADHDKAEELLPTESGFFFGTTDYDEYYFKDLEDTMKILELALTGTKFGNEKITYYASW